MASGDTKTEAMLNVLGNGGTGDEFRGCCNTKTQSYILDAIDRINALQPGGSSDFNDLENRPQLNGVAMTGDTNIANFTGTDGTNAGAQGLVPAPAAADADKFLKSDGTWATAGGDAYKNLTSADFNYPTNSPDKVALWLLPEGFYMFDTDDQSCPVYVNTNKRLQSRGKGLAFILNSGSGESPKRKYIDILFGSTSMSGNTGYDIHVLYVTSADYGNSISEYHIATHDEVTALAPIELNYNQYGRNWPSTGTKDGIAIFKVRNTYWGDKYRMRELVKLYITETYAIDNFTGYAERIIDRNDTNKSGYYIFDTNHGIQYFALTTNDTGVKTTLKKFEGTDI